MLGLKNGLDWTLYRFKPNVFTREEFMFGNAILLNGEVLGGLTEASSERLCP